MTFPIPDDEDARLAELDTYQIVDTMPEQQYDDIANLVAQVCGTSISTVALLDRDRKWHKAKAGISKEAVPREFAICSHTILGREPLIVNDTTEHEVFCDIGMVTNPPYVRFYAGVPLVNPDGFALGTLCAIDTLPKSLHAYQVDALSSLARQVVALLELHRTRLQLERTVAAKDEALANVKQLRELLPICCGCKKIRDDADEWHQLESYISQRTDATFTHGYCPDCVQDLLPGR
jgi:GAF domain-containing protein